MVLLIGAEHRLPLPPSVLSRPSGFTLTAYLRFRAAARENNPRILVIFNYHASPARFPVRHRARARSAFDITPMIFRRVSISSSV